MVSAIEVFHCICSSVSYGRSTTPYPSSTFIGFSFVHLNILFVVQYSNSLYVPRHISSSTHGSLGQYTVDSLRQLHPLCGNSLCMMETNILISCLKHYTMPKRLHTFPPHQTCSEQFKCVIQLHFTYDSSCLSFKMCNFTASFLWTTMAQMISPLVTFFVATASGIVEWSMNPHKRTQCSQLLFLFPHSQTPIPLPDLRCGYE